MSTQSEHDDQWTANRLPPQPQQLGRLTGGAGPAVGGLGEGLGQGLGQLLSGVGGAVGGLLGGQPPAQRAAGSPDLTAELERLAQLWQAGALSDSEFQAAKAKLLGS